ncbi:NUDIX domain-containing protein [Corynebacterium sp. zg-331]|uniref:NUDIX hydrolase n=1 Tax=unclassified Corynebacterium TaxID=2624378 RepID=UPI00128D4B7C|nr:MULTISPECIES: NUDIX domain-containing protein [unclassified Corynebacterium]MBC3186215.1 NUDIX domain-containing protein [Corynebacterium sp. zg-331]MPV52702.1 NUDIX hydrolase [Corynebacterium sp. zg331]
MDEPALLSATVLLVRDGTQGLEVWMQERVSTMPDYPGMTVFPGGRVDARDRGEVSRAWSGGSVENTARVLGTDTHTARGLVFAAVRELFEETGTLLAVHRNGATVGDAAPYHAERLALESHRLSLTEMLAANDLRVHADLLRPWAHWVGTSEKGRVFDTYSFLAVHPVGQEPDGASSEADSAGWFAPRLLLEGWRHGLVRLVIPTWAQLTRLSRCATVAEAVAEAEASDMTPVVGAPRHDPQYHEFYATPFHERI